MMHWPRLLAAVVIVITVGCARTPTQLHVTPLAEGEWIVAARTARGVVLQRTRDLQPRAGRPTSFELPAFALLTDTLTPLPADTFPVAAGDTRVLLARVGGGMFYTSATGQPRVLPSPADSQLYAVELPDGIWMFKTPDEMHKLTLDYDRAALATRQREGVVILYWSVNPTWSADGKFVAFLTNREAVRSESPGQAAWVMDVYTGVQGPLYDRAGASVFVSGVLGEEFVLENNRPAGITAVHPRTRAVRSLGMGYVQAGHPAGRAILINNNGQLTLLGPERVDTIAAPATGFVWSTQAAISPSGENVAIYSTDEAGVYMLHVIADGDTLPAYRLPALPSHGPAWISDDELIFSLQTRGGLHTYRARLR